MPRVKFFINDIERSLIKAEIVREGIRAVDQAVICVPPETPVCASDRIVYVQDMVDLDSNRIIYNFCQTLKDESGYNHNPIGHTDHPSPLVFLDFQCEVKCEGNFQLTPEVNCGCATFVAGKVHLSGTVDKAFCFEGTRYITLPCECKFDFRQDQKFTLAAWVFPTACAGLDGIIVKRNAFTCDAGYSLHMNQATGVMNFHIGEAAANFTLNSATCAVPMCMWTHVAATYDGTSCRDGMKLYINGELAVTGTTSVITGPVINDFVVAIGAQSDGGNLFEGRIDAVYIYDKELNRDEVKAMYYEGVIDYIEGLWQGQAVCFDGETGHSIVVDEAPACPKPANLKLQMKFECNLTDSSCTNTCITMGSGCATFTCGLIDDKAFCFNMCRSVVVAVACSNTNLCFTTSSTFTLATWVKSTDDSVSLMAKRRFTNAEGYDMLFTTCGDIRVAFEDCMGSTQTRDSLNQCVNDGEWHHVVATYDGTNTNEGWTIYVDGICDTGTTGGSDCIGTTTNVCIPFTVGTQNCVRDLCGLLDCVRVWNTVLTSKEVKNLYNSTFGHITGKYDILTWVKMPAAGSCVDRTIWHKSSSCTTGLHLHVNCNVCGGSQGFTGSGFTSSGFTTSACGGGSNCVAIFRHNSTTLTGTSDITDNAWHQIRVTRNGCDLISLYIDNVKEDCSTDATSPICTANLEFARDPCGNESYDEAIAQFRWYNGNLNSTEATNLADIRNPRSNIKFGGASTKITKEIAKKKLVVQSFGKELAEIEVRANQFCDRTPESILLQLIRDNTSLDAHFHGVPSTIMLGTYQADGKLVDITNDLTQLMGKVYHTDGLRQFHLHDNSFTLTTAAFDHRVNAINIPTAEDDTELVNDLLIIGQNKRFTTSCLFQGNGTTTTFNLSEKPVTARVEHPLCTELCPEVDYDFNSITKVITFEVAPACSCMNNILVEYEFERPLNIRGKKQSSINEHGTKAKRLVLPWITTRQDGVRFINAYLNQFKDINFRLEAKIPGLANGIQENDVISLVNTVKGVNSTFLIKSLTWNYPEAVTTLQLGEFSFQGLEFAKQITEKIHDLESAVVQVKDLRDFESPEELLALTATAFTGCTATCTLQFTECLSLTITGCVAETFVATYDCSCTTYDGDDGYN